MVALICNVVAIICFTILAVAFNKWWIVLFALLFLFESKTKKG